MALKVSTQFPEWILSCFCFVWWCSTTQSCPCPRRKSQNVCHQPVLKPWLPPQLSHTSLKPDHYTTCACLVHLSSWPIWTTFLDLAKFVEAAPSLLAFCAPPHLLLPHKVDIAFLSSWGTITATQIGGWITSQAGGCSQYFMQTVDIIWLSLMTIWYPLAK